jgi:hypothetical protein
MRAEHVLATLGLRGRRAEAITDAGLRDGERRHAYERDRRQADSHPADFGMVSTRVRGSWRYGRRMRQTGDAILVAENVKRLLRDDAVLLDARPRVPLKGKSESIMLYAPRVLETGEVEVR